MGKIDISLLVAFSFTPTALLKPCSLISPLFCLFSFFFFLFFFSLGSLSHFSFLSFYFFFLPFFLFCALQKKPKTPSFSPPIFAVPVSLITQLLCCVRAPLYNAVLAPAQSVAFASGLSATHTFQRCERPLMPPLNASLVG